MLFQDAKDLKADVRAFTGYDSELTLSADGLDVAYKNAKRHIRKTKSLDTEFEWFNPENDAAQDALYWWTCLNTKVQTGELDAQEIQAGAVDQSALLAKEDNEVTHWFRQARSSLRSVRSSSIVQVSAPVRAGRAYAEDGYQERNGSSTGGSGVDSSDIDTNL
jgi:hypothetical protein